MAPTLLKRFANSPTFKAFCIIFAVLLAAYALPPLMHRSQNPIYQRAGLSSELAPAITHGQSTIDPNDGFTSQALGHRAAESWLSGNVPYWNHDEGVGTPLAGEMQAAALSPFIVLLHFNNGLVYMHFLLQLIAGVAAYLFFRKLKMRFAVAVLGGVLFALSGAFTWLTNAPFNPIAFLPLLLLGIEQAISHAETKKKGGWVLIALALALSLYAGFPEGAFISALFAYGWAAIRLLQTAAKNRQAYIRKVIIGSAVGLLLAAPILVAFADYLPYAITGGHGNGGYANVSLPLSTLPALFMPYIFGPIFAFVTLGKPQDLFLFWSNGGGYITMPLLIAALAGLYAKRPASQKIYLSVFALIVMLKIYGFKPVAFLVNAIPGMDQVAFYRYSVPALSMAVIMLAMFGVEAMAKSQIRKKTVVILAGLVAAWTAMLAIFSRHLLHQLIAFPMHKWWAVVSVCWALSIVAVAGLAFARPRLRLLGLVILLGLDAFAMFTIPLLSLPKMTSVDQAPVSYLKQNMGLGRFYTLHPIQPNYGSYFDIASINTNDLPVPKKWAGYITKNLDSNAVPILFTGYSRANPNGSLPLDEFSKNLANYEKVGVKYLVADRGQVGGDYSQHYGLTKVFSDSSAEIFELPDPAPYYASSPSCSLTPKDRDNLVAFCSRPAVLTRQELLMPGWTASVNGKQQSVRTANDIFQATTLPGGKSTVRFTYAPPLINASYAAFGLGAALIVAGTVRSVSQRSRK